MTLTISDQPQTEADSTPETEQLLQRISVRSPYFALENLTVTDSGSTTARVPLARPSYPETGFMEATQVARHLAILGSCAVASQRDDDKRHHYLATKAHFLRTANVAAEEAPHIAVDSSATPLHLEAEASGTWIDRRSARALVKLMAPDGQASHVLDVHYTVMAPRMFNRLMPPVDLAALDAPSIQPHVMSAPEVRMLDTGGLVVDCGPIPIEMCAGHFPEYPAAPVALVMGRLARAAGQAMNRHLGFGDLTYQIDEAKVVATKLGRAGQRLILEARYGRRVGGGHLIIGTAKADGNVIGEMEITMSVTSLPELIPFPVNALA